MKIELRSTLFALGAALALAAGPLAAGDKMDHAGHGDKMDHAGHGDQMDHSGHGGDMDHAGHGDNMDHSEHGDMDQAGSGGEMDHTEHMERARAKSGAAPESLSITAPDLELMNHNGERVRFATDVLGDQLVVMDFIYTSCTTVCPVLSAIMSQVSDKLDSRFGDDVQLVSMSVDPGRDTPARLKSYGGKLGAGANWTFLTGAKNNVDRVLKEFGAYTPNFDDHTPMLVVGDPASGRWYRFFGFVSPDRLLGAVETLHKQRMTASSVQHNEEHTL